MAKKNQAVIIKTVSNCYKCPFHDMQITDDLDPFGFVYKHTCKKKRRVLTEKNEDIVPVPNWCPILKK